MNDHSRDEGIRAMFRARGHGEESLKLAASYCSPLFWAEPDEHGNETFRNGSAFYIDTGTRMFGVTAAHVVDGWREAGAVRKVSPLLLVDNNGRPPLALHWERRVIAHNREMDIATFEITADEVESIGKRVLRGAERAWPPNPPQVDRGIYLCGFPGVERRQPAPDEIEFSSCIGSGVASSVSDKDVSTVIEREHLIAILGDGIPPEDHDFRGISGGPMLTVVEGGRSLFALAGVIYSGPGTQDGQAQSMQGVEIIRARRAHFIRADGSLDEDRWAGTGWF